MSNTPSVHSLEYYHANITKFTLTLLNRSTEKVEELNIDFANISTTWVPGTVVEHEEELKRIIDDKIILGVSHRSEQLYGLSYSLGSSMNRTNPYTVMLCALQAATIGEIALSMHDCIRDEMMQQLLPERTDPVYGITYDIRKDWRMSPLYTFDVVLPKTKQEWDYLLYCLQKLTEQEIFIRAIRLPGIVYLDIHDKEKSRILKTALKVWMENHSSAYHTLPEALSEPQIVI